MNPKLQTLALHKFVHVCCKSLFVIVKAIYSKIWNQIS
jgi:hypothetical protein